jgi:ABC-2 type transport system ATP-binding protein
MSQAPVVAERLTKTFGWGRGITDVNLTLHQGEVFGFLGPNGAGKSTTIRCLLGLYRPNSGRARVLGHDPASDAGALLPDVGYLPGELHLPDILTGASIITRFGRARRLTDTAYRDELVDRFDVELDRPVAALSKGNKQKIGIVLAFMHRPRLLVLDEPTSGLDPLLQEEFATLVRETADDGRTVLLSSHNLDEVQRLVHQVAHIRAGRVIINDSVDALLAMAPRTIDLGFDHDVNAGPLAAIPGVTVQTVARRRLTLTYTGTAAPLLSAIAPMAPHTITARPADLDELFLRLYKADPDGPDQ